MSANLRLPALRRFAVAITVFNILGHTTLGFEQSMAQPLAALALAYLMEIVLELIDSKIKNRPSRLRGGPVAVINFLLPGHITALAVSMLLYSNERFFPILFATAVAVGSKYIFRVTIGNAKRHFMNPSNIGISTTLILFPWVGIAPPYHFVENISGIADWILPALIIISGTFLNFKFTKKIPLIIGWVTAFAFQAVFRSVLFGTPLVPPLLPMTGVAFVLFTFYMVSDPATTPYKKFDQFLFGVSVALAYGFLLMFHIVFGLFFSLAIVCSLRGIRHYIIAWKAGRELEFSTIETESALTRSATSAALKQT